MSEVRLRGSACRPLPIQSVEQRTIVIGMLSRAVPALLRNRPDSPTIDEDVRDLGVFSASATWGRRIPVSFNIEHGAVELAARDPA